MNKKNEIKDLLINLEKQHEFSFIANFHTESMDDLLMGDLKINFDYSVDVNSGNRVNEVYNRIFSTDTDQVYSTVLIYAFPSRILNKLYSLAEEEISGDILECGLDKKYLYATIDLNTFEIRYNDECIVVSYENRQM